MKTMTMTFAEFQATRRDANLEDLDRISYTYTPEEKPKAFVYIDELVIEDTSTWTNNPPKQYYLMIGNQEYFKDSLEPLERILYDYAQREGFIEEGDKPGSELRKRALAAYISESQDREGNTFYLAAICDEEKDEIVQELSDYDREDLVNEVLRQYPEIDIENG